MLSKKNAERNKSPFLMLRFGKLMFVLGMILMTSVSAFAQDPPPADGDPDAPFDGGISLLVAAGVAYGAKQWKESRKSNKTDESNSELEK